MKLLNKIQKLMYGRYGPDELYKFLFGLYIFILIINLFINNKWLSIIELLIIFIMFYRAFSKNILKRSKENKEYQKLKNNFLKPLKNIKRNITDKDNIYKKCHKCKTTLKLPIPYERGIKYTKCPKCHYRDKYLILKKQKIEIIRN